MSETDHVVTLRKETMTSSTFVRYIAKQIDESDKTQVQIAKEMGYLKPNIITMFKQGLTKVPLEKVPLLAAALGLDAAALMDLYLSEYAPSVKHALEDVYGPKPREKERARSGLLHAAVDGSDLQSVGAAQGVAKGNSGDATTSQAAADKSAEAARALEPSISADLPLAKGHAEWVDVRLTSGNVRNGHIYMRTALHLVPNDAIGGSSKAFEAKARIRVRFKPGDEIETDIAGDKGILRARSPVHDFFARSGAKADDFVRIRRVGQRDIEVTLLPAKGTDAADGSVIRDPKGGEA